MKTVTLQSILLRAWQRAGNDASDIANIQTGTRTMMVAAANERIRDCWEWADWPDLMRTELRTAQGDATNGYYIDYEQVGETAIGEVFAIYQDDPATHISPRPLWFRIENGKIWLATDAPDEVYVRYRIQPTEYSTSDLTEDVPQVISTAVGYLLASDLLEEDGQFDKAMALEAKAENELVKEQDKFVFQQGQTRRWTAAVEG
jgi:hypothetical protein